MFAVLGNLILRRAVVTGNHRRRRLSREQRWAAASAVATGELELIESSVTGNTARANGASGANGGSAVGGGIYANGPLNIVDSTISGNVAEAKGGQGPASATQVGGTAEAGACSSAL